MEEIMYQLLIQDQQIKHDVALRRQADTCLVYEGIFESFGYDTDDFLNSLDYYLAEPAKFEKVMEAVSDRLEREAGLARRELNLENWRDRLLRIYHLRPDTLSLPRPRPRAVDTLPARIKGDSVYLFREADTLVIPKDSLLFLRDSL